MKHLRKLLLLFVATLLFALGLAISPAPQQAVATTAPQTTRPPEKLPIYRLAAPNVSQEAVRQLANSAFGISEGVKQAEGQMAVQSGQRSVEVDTRSGGIWMADRSQLWNINLKPQLPDERRARAIADDFLSKNSRALARTDQEPSHTLAFSNTASTVATTFDVASKKRDTRKLDVQVNYTANITVRNTTYAVVGGGDEFSVTVGDQGKVTAFQGLFRSIAGVETESPVIPRERIEQEFRRMAGNLRVRAINSQLAYYSAPSGVEQRFLYPVWVIRATAIVGTQAVPLRIVTIPATEFGPKMQQPEPVRPRSATELPQRRSTMPEDKDERERGSKPNHFTPAFESGTAREGGSSYIGVSGGLAGSQDNAKGFTNGLSADGWSVNFLWGDAAAFESDWRRNDDSWVDAADFVFYTGHANMNGWVLSNPDDTFLDFSEVGAAPQTGDIWGFQDLEWVIIAACGPLQDNIISPGGGDVFARWDGAFDGLHQLLGYGAVTYDNTEEGKRVVQYARGGDTVIGSWFRAAKEIQPSTNGFPAPDGPTIYVSVMYVGRSGVDPGNDHIWGHGSVSGDPTSPTFYVAIWSPC
ncbi:MAG: hypothetical protein ICV60_12960 [Pyrinomonadaceae bacterium]|nr:hypothetical protein [Pyrinomonadaceae bacterium]